MLENNRRCNRFELIRKAQRDILQAIGPQAFLVERPYRYSKTGKVLTKRFIEITPYPWLEKLKKSAEKMEQDFSEVFYHEFTGAKP